MQRYDHFDTQIQGEEFYLHDNLNLELTQEPEREVTGFRNRDELNAWLNALPPGTHVHAGSKWGPGVSFTSSEPMGFVFNPVSEEAWKTFVFYADLKQVSA